MDKVFRIGFFISLVFQTWALYCRDGYSVSGFVDVDDYSREKCSSSIGTPVCLAVKVSASIDLFFFKPEISGEYFSCMDMTECFAMKMACSKMYSKVKDLFDFDFDYDMDSCDPVKCCFNDNCNDNSYNSVRDQTSTTTTTTPKTTTTTRLTTTTPVTKRILHCKDGYSLMSIYESQAVKTCPTNVKDPVCLAAKGSGTAYGFPGSAEFFSCVERSECSSMADNKCSKLKELVGSKYVISVPYIMQSCEPVKCCSGQKCNDGKYNEI